MEQLEQHVLLLRSCRNRSEAKRAHRLIRSQRSYNHDTYLANLIVETYARCRSTEDMLAAFQEISRPNCFSWNILLKGYTQNGYVDLARDVFRTKMQQHDLISFNTMLTAYVNEGDAAASMELFQSMRCTDSVSWTIMITAFSRNGDLQQARHCFDQMPYKTLPAYNSIITAYAHQGDLDQATDLFSKMPARELTTWNSLLVANARQGEAQAASCVFKQMPEHDLVSWNSLLEAHASLDGTCRMFESMPERDAVSWTRLVQAHVRHGHAEAAQRLVLDAMPEWTEAVSNCSLGGSISDKGIPCSKLEALTQNSESSACEVAGLAAAISGFAKAGNLEAARRVFVSTDRASIAAWNAMLWAYAHLGQMLQAKEFFDRMPARNCVSWNTIMAAYSSVGDVESAAMIFDRAPCKDVVAWNTLIRAFARWGHLVRSRRLFDEMPVRSVVSWATMVQAYFEAGSLSDALLLFRDMPERQIASWNLVVAAFGQYGLHARATTTFERAPERDNVSYNAVMACYNSCETLASKPIELVPEMTIQGFDPDKTTILLALVACGRRGLVDKSRKWFVSMLQDHGHVVESSCEHYYSMVDQLARAGRLVEAEELLETMPFQPDAIAWRALLGACCGIHPDEDAQLRCKAADGAVQEDPSSSAPYALVAKRSA